MSRLVEYAASILLGVREVVSALETPVTIGILNGSLEPVLWSDNVTTKAIMPIVPAMLMHASFYFPAQGLPVT